MLFYKVTAEENDSVLTDNPSTSFVSFSPAVISC